MHICVLCTCRAGRSQRASDPPRLTGVTDGCEWLRGAGNQTSGRVTSALDL